MKKIAILTIALASAVGLFAQHNEEITIEGSYRPKVNKVDKILLTPDTPEQSFTMPDAKSKVLDIDHRFRLNLDKLSPLAYNNKKGLGDGTENNFLMAAFGSRISPCFLYKHNSKLGKDFGLNVGVKHYSSWLDMKKYAPSGFMNNAVEVGVTDSDFFGFQLGGKVYYKNDLYHYYGVQKADWAWDQVSLVHGAPRQVYNTFGTHWDLVSTTMRIGDFVHDVGLDYHYMSGEIDNGREHHIALDYDLGYVDSWWGKKEYPQKVGVDVGLQYGYSDLLEQRGYNRLYTKVNPYFEMNGNFYRLHLGFGVDAASRFNTWRGIFRIYPDLKGNLFVLNNALEFYAGLNGGRKWIGYSELVGENPFVSNQLKMEVTTVKLAFEGGVRTNIMNTVDVHVGVRYRNTENDYFFSQRITPSYNGMTQDRPFNSFDVIYDDSRLVTVLGDVRCLIMDNLTVDAGFAYNKCDPATEEHAWYRPTTQGNLNVNYQLNEELSFDASFLYQGGRWAKTGATTTSPSVTLKLGDAYDLGLGANYKLREHLSVFMKVDNLLHRKYQYYLDYPVTGIEAFAGIKMAF